MLNYAKNAINEGCRSCRIEKAALQFCRMGNALLTMVAAMYLAVFKLLVARQAKLWTRMEWDMLSMRAL